MLKALKNLDTFTKNIIIVFAGTSLANFFNLLYQLLIAHKLSAAEFASFNALLAIFMLVTAPLGTFQIAITKYTSEFNAQQKTAKIKFFLSEFLKKALVLSGGTLLIFWLISGQIMKLLKIPSLSCGYILAILIALAWLGPLFSGSIQGLELFTWLASASIITGLLKLILAFIFILLGYNIAGALGALLISNLISIIILSFPLKTFFSFKLEKEAIDYNKIFVYLFPVAISYFCWIALISFDMVLVKYFFSPEDSGVYSLAQMVGKIFLFLPGAISLVMFPKTSGLNAKKMDTSSVLRKSLFYVFILSISAIIFYNLFPEFVLKVLTGKVNPGSIFLGRLFSISMSFFAALFILISYFLSINNSCFLKYLVSLTICQFLGILFFHTSLTQVQFILCANAILLFIIHLVLAFKAK